MKSWFCEALCQLRHNAGFSQRAAANELGVSQALLSHYENGAREPKLEFVVKVCSYYGVSADYLLGRSNNDESKSTVPLLCSSDSEITLASTLQEILAALSGLDDKELTIAAVVYLTAAVEKITNLMADPYMPYDPMCDAKMKMAEASFLTNIKRVTGKQDR